MGFGLDAYVAIGTNSEGSHAWVITRKDNKINFWESLTGTKMSSEDPRVHRFYRTIGCVFNNTNFMGNIQADDRVVNTNWDFEDEYMWKAMSSAMLNTLTTSTGIGYLMPSIRTNTGDDEKMLEGILKDKIGSIRRNEHGLGTTWDMQMSYLLSTAVSNYENEKIGGKGFSEEEFQEGIKNHVPQGHTFLACPIEFRSYETDDMIRHILKQKTGQEVFLAKGDQARHALRIKIVQYPENKVVVWVMLAVRFKSTK